MNTGINMNKSLKKKNKGAIVLGCGKSVNQLTVSHLEWLSTLDKWTSNNFIIHDFIIPDFYNIEVKSGIRYDFLKKIINQKRKQYKNTTWLVEEKHTYKGKKIIPNLVNILQFNSIYTYETNYLNSINGKYKSIYGTVQAVRGLGMSILIDIVGSFNYKVIYFLGIDLCSSEYFWTDNKRFKNLNIPKELEYNKACEEGNKNKQHNSASKLIPFLKGYIKYNHIKVINLSKDSLLSDIMKTEEIPCLN